MGPLMVALVMWGLSAAAQTPVEGEDTPAAGGVTAESGLTPARVRWQPRLDYPNGARFRIRLASDCRVRFTLDAEGSVSDVRVSGCDAMFVREVEAKAPSFRFEPAMQDGVAIASEYDLAVRFRIEGREEHASGVLPGALWWTSLTAPVTPVSPSVGPDPWGLGIEAGLRWPSKLLAGARMEHQIWGDWEDQGSLSRTQAHVFVGFDAPAPRTRGWTWSGGVVPTVGAGLGHQVERVDPEVASATFGMVNAGVRAWVGRRVAELSFARVSAGVRYDGVPRVRADSRIAPAHLSVGLGVGRAP